MKQAMVTQHKPTPATTKNKMHGPLTRHVELWVVRVLGMPGTFPLPLTSKETAS